MTVIKVDQISKRYRLGLKEKKVDTLVGKISQTLRSPWINLKRLRELSRFVVEDESVFWALKDVSFEVQQGEVLGIIGKNGAGKSTLLKILSKITEPTSGRIEIRGRVASLLEVGTGFHPELSGRDNIYMNGTILGMTRKEINRKLDEIVDFSGVEKFLDTPVKYYSSGMKVRLGFSIAAHLDPEILIIDEVLAVGDYEFQKKCLGKMEDVSRHQGRTVLFVSHDLNSILNLCPNSLLLHEGTVIFADKSSNVINEYSCLSNGKNELKKFNFNGELINTLFFNEVRLNDQNVFSQDIVIQKHDSLKICIYGTSKIGIFALLTISIFKDGIRIGSLFDSNVFSFLYGEFISTFTIDISCFKPGLYTLGLGSESQNGDWIWNDSFATFKIIEKNEDSLAKLAIGLMNMKPFSKSERRCF